MCFEKSVYEFLLRLTFVISISFVILIFYLISLDEFSGIRCDIIYLYARYLSKWKPGRSPHSRNITSFLPLYVCRMIHLTEDPYLIHESTLLLPLLVCELYSLHLNFLALQGIFSANICGSSSM